MTVSTEQVDAIMSMADEWVASPIAIELLVSLPLTHEAWSVIARQVYADYRPRYTTGAKP